MLACITLQAASFTANTHRATLPHLQSTASNYGYETPINIEENAPRDIASMEQWAYNYGIQRCDGFELVSSQVEYGQPDVYAATSVDLPAGSAVLYVPEELILSSDKAIAELRSNAMQPAEKILKSINADSELRHYYLMIKVSVLREFHVERCERSSDLGNYECLFPACCFWFKILVELQKGEQSPWFPWLNSLPRYFTNAASMTPFCCLCLPSLMRKLAVRERGNMSRLSVSSIKLIPFLNDDFKYDVELCNWVYQVVYTRSFETEDGDLRIVPMGDVSYSLFLD
jgi:hypothetical protein